MKDFTVDVLDQLKAIDIENIRNILKYIKMVIKQKPMVNVA